jgi:hypothetical protein
MSELVMYLFGERNPEIAALLRERSFQSLVGDLFQAEEPALPREPPPVWNDAVRLDLLASAREGEGYRAGRRLVLIPAAAERGAAGLLRPALTRYVEIAAAACAELRAAYHQTAVAGRFSWPQVSHSILAGLFLDLAMGREVLRAGVIARQPAGDSLAGGPIIWAFQGVSAQNAYGVSAIPAGPPYQAFFAQLWHRRIGRAEPRLSPALLETMVRIARGEEGSPRDLLILKHLKLVRTAGRGLRLQVPAFGEADTARLRGPLERGARRLVADAILPALDLLERHPWWREGLGSATHRHAAIRLILEHGIDRVIAEGVCDPFPEDREIAVEWGRWLWDDPAGDLLP